MECSENHDISAPAATGPANVNPYRVVDEINHHVSHKVNIVPGQCVDFLTNITYIITLFTNNKCCLSTKKMHCMYIMKTKLQSIETVGSWQLKNVQKLKSRTLNVKRKRKIVDLKTIKNKKRSISIEIEFRCKSSHLSDLIVYNILVKAYEQRLQTHTHACIHVLVDWFNHFFDVLRRLSLQPL